MNAIAKFLIYCTLAVSSHNYLSCRHNIIIIIVQCHTLTVHINVVILKVVITMILNIHKIIYIVHMCIYMTLCMCIDKCSLGSECLW